MAARLGDNSYGKSRIRLVRVSRDGERHSVADLTVDVAFDGRFEAVHLEGDGAADLVREAAAVLGVLQRDIVDRPAAFPQLGGEVADGREDQNDLVRVMADVSGLLRHLHHQHNTGRRIDIAEAGEAVAELVAEDGDEGRHSGKHLVNAWIVRTPHASWTIGSA